MYIEKLKEILNSVNPAVITDGVNQDTKLVEDLGLDSLNMMLLAVSVEDEFGFRFDDMPVFETVGDISLYIEKKTASN